MACTAGSELGASAIVDGSTARSLQTWVRGVATPPRAVIAPLTSPSPSPATVLTSSASLAGLLAGSSNAPSASFQLSSSRASPASKMITSTGTPLQMTTQASLGMGNRGSGSLRGSLQAMGSSGSCTPPLVSPLTPSVSSRSAPTPYASIVSSNLPAPDEASLLEGRSESLEIRGVVGLESAVQRLEAELAELSASEAAQQQRLAEVQKLLAAEEHAACEQRRANSQEMLAEEQEAYEQRLSSVLQASSSSSNGHALHGRLPTRMVSWSAGQWTPPQSRLRVDMLPLVTVATAPAATASRTALASPAPTLIPAPPVRPAPVWGPSRGASRNTSFETSPGNSREAPQSEASRGRQRGVRSLSPSGDRTSSVSPFKPFTWVAAPIATSPRLSSVPPVLSPRSMRRSRARFPQLDKHPQAQPAPISRTLTPPRSVTSPRSMALKAALTPRSKTPPLEVAGSFLQAGAERAREMSCSRWVTTLGGVAAASSSPSRDISPRRWHQRQAVSAGRPLSPPRDVSPTRRFLINPAKSSFVAPASSHVETTWRSQQALSAMPASISSLHHTQMISCPPPSPVGQSTSAIPGAPCPQMLVQSPLLAASLRVREREALSASPRAIQSLLSGPPRSTSPRLLCSLPQSPLLAATLRDTEEKPLVETSPLQSSATTLLEESPRRLSHVLLDGFHAELTSLPSPDSLADAGNLAKQALCGKLRPDEVLPPQCLQPIAMVAEKVQQLRQYFESQKQLAMTKALQVGVQAPVQASLLANGVVSPYTSSATQHLFANNGDLAYHEAEDDNLVADDAYVGEVFMRMARQLEVLEEILELTGPLSVAPPSKVELDL